MLVVAYVVVSLHLEPIAVLVNFHAFADDVLLVSLSGVEALFRERKLKLTGFEVLSYGLVSGTGHRGVVSARVGRGNRSTGLIHFILFLLN